MIVNCQLDNGTIIDIARRWFTEDIREGDTIDIEFDMQKCNICETQKPLIT